MKALIFDFGNVIAFFSHYLACQQIAALSERQVQAGEVHHWIFGTGRHIELESGNSDPDQFLRDLQAAFAPAATLDQLRAAYTDIFQPNPAVTGLIPRLPASLPIFLASNTDHHHWSHFSVLMAPTFSRFAGFVKSYEIGFRKPAIEFYKQLVARAGVLAGDCIFVDDIAENVACACALGMKGIVYSPNLDLEQELRAQGIEF
jgi:putative hydrolase of the HAD superfamily